MLDADGIPDTSRHFFEDARFLVVEARVAREAAAAMLPPPLRLADPPTAEFFFADYPRTAFGSVYKEGGILLHAEDADGPLLHCPWIVVDDGTALVLGRDLLGFPKKLGEVSFELVGDSFTGVVRRNAIELMRIEAELGEIEDPPTPVLEGRAVNAIGSLLTGMKLIEARTGEDVRSVRLAHAKVHLGSSPRDPLGGLEPTVVGPGRYAVLDYGGGGGLPRVVGDVDAGWVSRNFWVRSL